jgi:hypothetical protein
MICAYFRFSINLFDINTLWAVLIILDLLTKIVMPHPVLAGHIGGSERSVLNSPSKGRNYTIN